MQIDSLRILAIPKKTVNCIVVNVQVLTFQSKLKLKLYNAFTTAMQLTAGLSLLTGYADKKPVIWLTNIQIQLATYAVMLKQQTSKYSE